MVTILIDGNSSIHELFSSYCQESPDIQLFIPSHSIQEGLESISTYRPQLVFLGNNMEDGNANDLLEQTHIPFETVLLFEKSSFTGLPYRPEILAYILHPVSKVAFDATVKKAVKKLQRVHKLEEKVDLLSSKLTDWGSLPSFFSISNTEGVLFRKVNDIICLNAQKNYTEFVMANTDTPLIASSNLGAFESQFKRYPNMKKIHRSHMVNLNHASAFLRKDGGYLIMRKGMKLKVSKHYKQDILDTMRQL